MQEIAAEREMVSLAAEAARGGEMKPGDHPADLDEHEIRKRLDVLVVDRLPVLNALDHDRIRRRGHGEISERPRIALPVRMLDLVLENPEDVELVGVPDVVRSEVY